MAFDCVHFYIYINDLRKLFRTLIFVPALVAIHTQTHSHAEIPNMLFHLSTFFRVSNPANQPFSKPGHAQNIYNQRLRQFSVSSSLS